MTKSLKDKMIHLGMIPKKGLQPMNNQNITELIQLAQAMRVRLNNEGEKPLSVDASIIAASNIMVLTSETDVFPPTLKIHDELKIDEDIDELLDSVRDLLVFQQEHFESGGVKSDVERVKEIKGRLERLKMIDRPDGCFVTNLNALKSIQDDINKHSLSNDQVMEFWSYGMDELFYEGSAVPVDELIEKDLLTKDELKAFQRSNPVKTPHQLPAWSPEHPDEADKAKEAESLSIGPKPENPSPEGAVKTGDDEQPNASV